jgi:hypothetical protein
MFGLSESIGYHAEPEYDRSPCLPLTMEGNLSCHHFSIPIFQVHCGKAPPCSISVVVANAWAETNHHRGSGFGVTRLF